MKKSGNVEKFDMQLTPFSHHRLYAEEKYSLQNMVLNMVNFPAAVDHSVDQTFSIYSDRAHTEWHAAARLFKSTETGDAWFHGLKPEDFLLYAGKVFAAINTRRKITGDALVCKAYEYEHQFSRRVSEIHGAYALSGVWEHKEGMSNDDYSKYLRLSIEARERAEKQAMEEIEPMKLTGALMIRMTNVSSGYPCPVLIGVKMKSKQSPLTVSYPREREFMDMYGNAGRW